eukprot:08609_3
MNHPAGKVICYGYYPLLDILQPFDLRSTIFKCCFGGPQFWWRDHQRNRRILTYADACHQRNRVTIGPTSHTILQGDADLRCNLWESCIQLTEVTQTVVATLLRTIRSSISSLVPVFSLCPPPCIFLSLV